MSRFVKVFLVPLLTIIANGFFGWASTKFFDRQNLNISDSEIFWLTGASTIALLILTLLSSDPQQNSPTTNQNRIGGFLPLIGGAILAIPLYLKLVPTEFSTVFSYASIGMFGLGAVLPPVLILPKKWRQKILWLIPGATLFLTVHFILKQQSIAAILCLILTVMMTVILASQDFWQQLIAELSTMWQGWQRQGAASVAAWIKSKLEDLWIESTSPFQREYYETLKNKCRKLETQGLDGDGKLDLQKVYVPLKIAVKDAANVSQRMIYQQQNLINNQKQFQIWDFLAAKDDAGKIKFPHMVILGAPGSGKTTLLRHITLIYATKQESKINPPVPKLIPVLLYLRELRQEIISNNPSLPNLITQQINQQKFNDQPLNPPPDWFADKLREQKCLVMLDGLDEVADQTQRQQISRWVGEQMQNYPHTAFILTSRPNGYRTARLQGVEELEVQLFNQKQREDFLHHWYLQKEAHDNRWVIDEGVKQDAETAANDLIQRIENSRPLKAMAVNPLLLTMIATVHRYRGVLPGKRVRLYKEICEILLEKRQTAKKIPDVLTASDKQPILQVLALQLMQNNTREFSLSEATALIPVDMLQTFPLSLANAEDFLKHIRDDCGLLVEKELGIYEFAHLSFQEYLAAVQIKESNQENLLIANINNSWWAETIRLYAAQINNASNLMRAVINMPTPSVNAFVLVSDYKEEGWRIDPQLKQQLIDKLDAGLESHDPEIFKLAAQVKLTRRLNNLQPVDENLEIDTSYITCAEYQLFINEQGSSQRRFDAGNAKHPIVEISWENVLGFCNWLNLNPLSLSISNYENSENSSVYYYRLPTLAEAQNYLTQARCWTIDGDNTGEKEIRVVKNRVDQEYTELANYLAVADWEKAAQETVKVMKVANRQSEGEFDVASIKKLPDSCLITIDLLWMQYSTGRFGWGVRDAKLSSAKSDLRCGWWLNTSGNLKEIFEALVQKHDACGIKPLPPLFAFDVVTVKAQGQEIQWERRQAQYFTEDLGNSVNLDMVAIRGGTFTMGSPKTEAESRDSERPQHEVTVASFFMGKYPITQAQWRLIASRKDLKVERDLEPNPSKFKDSDRCPVEQVSWYDAVEFCARLSQYTGKSYSLPSEAEWEYACRAGTKTPFHFGETITSKLVNYNASETYGAGIKGTYREKTTEVGSFGVANAFGLYDMHGNVWEWCLDDSHSNYEGAPTDGSAWFDNNHDLFQKQGRGVLRGGSWGDNPNYCRSASRLNDVWAVRVNINYDVGFRVVCAVGRIL